MNDRRKTMIEKGAQTPHVPEAIPFDAEDSVEIIEDDKVAAPRANLSAPPPKDSRSGAQKAPEDGPLYRPVNRPPMGLLIIHDDGSVSGERYRVREEHTVIGREGCDICIGHDPAMSTRHTEIVRNLENGRYRWYIRDLGSTNGTFVRIYKTNLKHDQEWMIGSNRYRYRMAQASEATSQEVASDESPKRHNSTMGWQAISTQDLQQNQPSLVMMLPSGEDGESFPFTSEKLALGSDPGQCNLVLKDDPYVCGRHAKIRRSSAGPWKIVDAGSVNGLWLRISSLPIDKACDFLLGEQRFTFKVM